MDKQYISDQPTCNNIRFRTKRLLVRDVIEADYAVLHTIYTNPEVMRFISTGRYDWTLQEIRNKYNQANIHNTTGFGLFAIQLPETPVVIGEAGLFNSFNNPEIVELGYILDRHWWGNGYGTEICRGLIGYCREVLHARKVVARMYAANTASVQLSETVGMVRVENGYTPDNREFYQYELEVL